MMRVFALDAAARRTGWAVLDHNEGGPTLVDHGSLTLPDKMTIGHRLMLLHNTLEDLIEDYNPDEIAVEEPYIRFVKTSIVLIKISGIIQYATYSHLGKEAVYVHPSTVRAQLGIKTKGDVAKVELAAIVKDHFGIEVEEGEYDETDAIGVGWVAPIVIRRNACRKPKRKKRKKKGNKPRSSS